jgi:hypothetical protein
MAHWCPIHPEPCPDCETSCWGYFSPRTGSWHSLTTLEALQAINDPEGPVPPRQEKEG